MRFLSVLLFITLLYLLHGCSTSKIQAVSTLPVVTRPVDAWVIRSVVDQKPRMLSIALDSNLWLAYNTQTGSLYKAWAGKVSFDGSVYTARHGVQPTTQGVTYMQEPDGVAWRLVINNTEIIPEVYYKGHTITDNRVMLKYELVYNGQKITIEERPEYIGISGEQVGFERIFTTTGVPAGVGVALRMYVGSLTSEADFTTDGRFNVNEKVNEELEGKNYLALQGLLMLNGNGKTRFYAKMVRKPNTVSEKTGTLTSEEKIHALIANTDCSACHNKDMKTVGPSYMAIASQYENTLGNQEMLVEKIITGGAGNWGQIPMTPHPDLSREDATSIVSYILSLDAKEEQAKTSEQLMPKPDYPVALQVLDAAAVNENAERPGIAINAYQFNSKVLNLPDITPEMRPFLSGSVNTLHLAATDFARLKIILLFTLPAQLISKNRLKLLFVW